MPEGRAKPWGTAHAVACCRDVIDAPFAVINADDYYGAESFALIYQFLTQNTDPHEYALVGYHLGNTVSEHGSVARGVCEVEDGCLRSIVERTKIFKRGDDAEFTEDGEHFQPLPGSTPVSMNLWGFTPAFVDSVWQQFPSFLCQTLRQNPQKSEFYLPNAVEYQLERGEVRVKVLTCGEKWYGVTYREDLETVHSAMRAMKESGKYPRTLWK